MASITKDLASIAYQTVIYLAVIGEGARVIDSVLLPGAADLFIVARDLEDFIAGIPEDEKIVLSNILDKDEMKEKLTEKFGL